MHLPDIVPAPLCIGGYAVTGLLTWVSLRQIRRTGDPAQGIPRAALLTGAFFAASLIHIPVPPASAHLVLNGLLGCVLGYFAFPAIVVGLFLQAVLFGFGGLSTLGLNAVIMGLPALLAYQIFQLRLYVPKGNTSSWLIGSFAFLAGALGLGLAVLLFWGLALAAIPADVDAATEQAAILLLVATHIPLMLVEGLFTALLVLFLQRVKPELLVTEG